MKLLGGGLGHDAWIKLSFLEATEDNRYLIGSKIYTCKPYIYADGHHVAAIKGCELHNRICAVISVEDAQTNLPNKFSDLLELALSDLESCEADPRFQIRMCDWLRVKDETCYVCLAGAVMAKTLGAPLTETSLPSFYDLYDRQKLVALDSLRLGLVETAFIFVGQTTSLSDKTVHPYEDDPVQFKADIRNLIHYLRENGE